MRIRVKFRSQRLRVRLPLNYNYHLTALIYHLLERSSGDYSTFLHDEGYRSGSKSFKLFTYSQLQFESFELEPPEIVSFGGTIEWQISSPVREFVEHLAQGLLSQGQVQLAGVLLQIERIETLSPPEFSERMKFICLSPLVVSRAVEKDGKLIAHYYRHDEMGLAQAVRANLLKKYELIHGETLSFSELTTALDESYIRRRGGQIYKLIDFKGTKIKGILAPFTVEGSPELIEVGYEAGFGEKNSMGFGMVEAVSDAETP
jgi:CRISPR-associated endoribonuclease Cas6